MGIGSLCFLSVCLASTNYWRMDSFLTTISHKHRRPVPIGDRCCSSVGAQWCGLPRWIHCVWPDGDKRRVVRSNEGATVKDWKDLSVKNPSWRRVWKVFGCWMAMRERDQRNCLSHKQLSHEGALCWSFGCPTLHFFRSARFWRLWRGFRASVSVFICPGPWWWLSLPGDAWCSSDVAS